MSISAALDKFQVNKSRLAILAGEAGSGPAAHVAIHTGPDEPLRDELDGGLDARARQVVQSLGEGPAQRPWEERPRRSGGLVAEQTESIADWDVAQAQ